MFYFLPASRRESHAVIGWKCLFTLFYRLPVPVIGTWNRSVCTLLYYRTWLGSRISVVFAIFLICGFGATGVRPVVSVTSWPRDELTVAKFSRCDRVDCVPRVDRVTNWLRDEVTAHHDYSRDSVTACAWVVDLHTPSKKLLFCHNLLSRYRRHITRDYLWQCAIQIPDLPFFKVNEICLVGSQEKHYNCCHQMSYFKFKMHKNQFRLGLRPRPRWGSLQRSPRPRSWI